MGTKGQYVGERLLSGISRDMQRLLEDFIACKNPQAAISHLGWKPATDIFETERAIVVRMDIAAVTPNEVLLGFDSRTNTLTIAGKRTDKRREPKIGYHQMEIIYGPFHRRIVIPKPVDVDNVSTSYENGFLEITFPKTEQPKAKTVTIRIRF
jgi:HSP20 family protein